MSLALLAHLLLRGPIRLLVAVGGQPVCYSLCLCCCPSRWALCSLCPVSMDWALLLVICPVVCQISSRLMRLGVRGRQLICQAACHSLGSCHLEHPDHMGIRFHK